MANAVYNAMQPLPEIYESIDILNIFITLLLLKLHTLLSVKYRETVSTVLTKEGAPGLFLQVSEIHNKGRFDISSTNHISGYSHHSTRYGIKFVLSGEESYEVNHQEFSVGEGEYLLVNKDQQHAFEVKQKEPAQALCIGLDESLLTDVFYNLTTRDEQQLDLPSPFQSADLEFLEMVYPTGNNPLGIYLKNLKDQIIQNNHQLPIAEEELYYTTAYHLLLSQAPLLKQINQLSTRKKSTSEELFRRLYKAKSIMDQNCLQPVAISQLCKEVALSEFHFYRSFKKAFGLSPHQYYLQQKLETAKQLLLSNQYTITDVALLCGFADLPTFRKSFKKAFALSPQAFVQHAGRQPHFIEVQNWKVVA